MSKEPDNLILHHLKALRAEVGEMRQELHTVRLTVAGHDLRFDSLDERFELVREGTLTAIGFAADASRSIKTVREQVADLTRRVEKLEKTQ